MFLSPLKVSPTWKATKVKNSSKFNSFAEALFVLFRLCLKFFSYHFLVIFWDKVCLFSKTWIANRDDEA